MVSAFGDGIMSRTLRNKVLLGEGLHAGSPPDSVEV
jgi:hypothetical protein